MSAILTHPTEAPSKVELDPQRHIAAHLQTIPPSGIRDFFEIVQTMEDVISLGVGEPDYVTPWHIREAAIYSLERGRTSYTSNWGLPKLRSAIAAYVQRHFGVSYDPKNEILATVGVSEALDIAFRAILNPGDEVLFHEPCYVSYHPGAVLAYGVPVGVPARDEDAFAVRAEAFAERITPRTKAIMLSFPTNPTGATLPKSELEKIAELCMRHDLVAITDEIYSELTYDGASHCSIASLPGMRERTILLHGFSKAFAMTGFRIGYACAPAPLAQAMTKIHQYSMLCASITSQDAAIEALERGEPSVRMMRDDYQRRRDFMVKAFNEMGLPCHKPGGAFYVFPNITATGMKSREFSLQLLQEQKVAVVPGGAFGATGEGFVRCCYATSFERLQQAVARIGTFLEEHRS